MQKYLLQTFRHFFICNRQVTSMFTFFSDYPAKLLFLKSLRSIEMNKLLVTTVVPKLQSLILRVTRRVVLLVHCIVPHVPISPQNPKMIWITILLRSTAPQNLMSPSNVNFVFKSFQDFTLYVNTETLKTECRSDQEQELWMWNTYKAMLRITGWEKSCVLVNISWWIPNLKRRDKKCSNTQWKPSTKQPWTRNDLFSTIWKVQQKWIWLLVSVWKI